MPGPLDIVRLVHSAIREDFHRLEMTVLHSESQGEAWRKELRERFSFLRTYLSAHDAGEADVLMSPPLTTDAEAAPYRIAHRSMQEAVAALDAALEAGDIEELRRAATQARAVVTLHLDMEDEHLFPLCESRLTPEEQLKTLGKLSERIPPEISMRTVRWMPPLLPLDGREALLRFYMANIPTGPRESVLEAVRESLGTHEWEELRQRVPELEA